LRAELIQHIYVDIDEPVRERSKQVDPILALPKHIPNYTVAQLEQMGELPFTDANGQQQLCGVFSAGMLGSSASALTSSDISLINACTGAQISTSRIGVQLSTNYSPSVPISSQQLATALATLQATNTNKNITPSQLRDMAMGQAQYTDAQNFVNALAAVRQSVGPNQPITPSMILAMVKQANANNTPIPQEYVANAIGYLNGIRTTNSNAGGTNTPPVAQSAPQSASGSSGVSLTALLEQQIAKVFQNAASQGSSSSQPQSDPNAAPPSKNKSQQNQ
jgi:hypothetical protein